MDYKNNWWPSKILQYYLYSQFEFQQRVHTKTSLLKSNELLVGRLQIETEKTVIDFEEYSRFVDDISAEMDVLDEKRNLAMSDLIKKEENLLSEWLQEDKEKSGKNKEDVSFLLSDPNMLKVKSSMAANIFMINCSKGDIVGVDDTIVILEAMKMEIAIKPINVTEDSESEDEDVLQSFQKQKNVLNREVYKSLGITVTEGEAVSPGTVLVILRSACK